MPPPRNADVLLKVEQVDAMITPNPPHIPIMLLEIEDGRTFKLYGIPYEIVIAINKIRYPSEADSLDYRESFYEIVLDFKEYLEDFGKLLNRVIIDSLDYTTGLYSATAEFILEGILIKRRMIPSHAVFLALLFNKPVYVKKSLIDEQEEYERRMQQEEELRQREEEPEEDEEE